MKIHPLRCSSSIIAPVKVFKLVCIHVDVNEDTDHVLSVYSGSNYIHVYILGPSWS